MNKISLRNLKKEAKNIDIEKMDVGSFWESLLLCGPAVTQFCKSIDKEMNDITTFAYSACIEPLEQYNHIVENMSIKSQLLTIRKVFADWYVKLSDDEKKCCKDYVIWRYKKLDGRIGGRPGNAVILNKKERDAIRNLILSFRNRVKATFDLNEKNLIRNPYIYTLYAKIAYRKEYNRVKGVV